MSENKDKKTVKRSNKDLGGVVIFICIFALLFCGCAWLYHSLTHEPKINKVEVEFVSSDSLLNRNYITHEQVDSLIRVVNKHEAEIADKYQYFIEQKYNEDKYFSVFTVILGVVFSLFGFFGYKSITGIEEKSTKIAREVAEKSAEETSEKIADAFMKENARKYVDQASKELFESKEANVMKEKIKAELYKYFEIWIDYSVSNKINELKSSDNSANNASSDSDNVTTSDDNTEESLF